MAVAPGRKLANSRKPDSELTTSRIQAFKLQRQNRPREAYLINAQQVQARTHPRELQKRPNFKRKRQVSATLPTSVGTSVGSTISVTDVGSSTILSPPPEQFTTVTATPPITGLSIIVVIIPGTTPGQVVTTTIFSSRPDETGIIMPTPGTIPGQGVPKTSSPGLPTGSGIMTTTSGTIPGQVVTTTVSPISSSSTLSTSLPSESTTNGSSALGTSPSSRTRLERIVVGSVIGGIIPVLLLLCLLLRWRKRQRQTRPILLADPFPEVRGTTEQQRNALIAMPQPSAFGAAMVATTSDTSSPQPAKFAKLLPSSVQESHAHEDSISPTNSPGSNISPQDTMLEIQALRQRILEVENMALRQRVADAENMARGRQETGESSTAPRVDRASESPPEYVSPVDETRSPHGQN